MVGLPTEPVEVSLGQRKMVLLRWKDKRGKQHVIWWRPDNDPAIGAAGKGLNLPPRCLVADPLHGRLLKINSPAELPLCNWPLIAREL